MLAATCTDTAKLRYPVLMSPKLDGVRALVLEGRLVSRKLKPIPNIQVQWLFQDFCKTHEGFDGELIVGDPTAKDAYRKTMSMVMSDNVSTGWRLTGPDRVRMHCFDTYLGHEPFERRFSYVYHCLPLGDAPLQTVPHTLIQDEKALLEKEQEFLAAGYEGGMLRSLDGPYKFGRSTDKEGYLLKLKRFCDAEAIVVGVFEQEHNANEATLDELGYTKHSTHQAGKIGMGVLGGLIVQGIGSTQGPTGNGSEYAGMEFSIGTGFNADQRKRWWLKHWAGLSKDKELGSSGNSLIGRIVRYKYFPSGSKDKPRFPVFLGFRNQID